MNESQVAGFAEVSRSKPVIKLEFVDFWGDFEKTNNYFWNLLSPHYELVLSDDPDFLIYSAYGREFSRYDCLRIFYTAENVRPDFRECDFAFSFDYLNTPRNYRLPLYALYRDNTILTTKSVDPEQLLREKTRFCNFVVSNPKSRLRNEFFQKLSSYKKVDSAGRFMNNIGRSIGTRSVDKWEFLRPYKFTIAFENSSYPGYTTEKIFEPMLVNSLPIYWGNPVVDRDFNPRSFLNYYDFPDENALIARIVEVDESDDLYLKYMAEPWFPGGRLNAFVDPQNVIRQFRYIFSHLGSALPVAKTRMRFYSIGKGATYWGKRKFYAAKDRFGKALLQASRQVP
jgi:hypothetical protein